MYNPKRQRRVSPQIKPENPNTWIDRSAVQQAVIGSSVSAMESSNEVLQSDQKTEKPQKPPFRRAQDDTKPPLHDPMLRSDPIETEEAVLRLPPPPSVKSGFQSR